MYTILIGSYARGTNRPESDYDVVRINHTAELDFDYIPSSQIKISYIDYSEETFADLYKLGSLFLYHIFYEGKLLHGNKKDWRNLKENFNVCQSFKKEILEYLHLINFLNSDKSFHHATFAYLSNMFKAIKNISIFYLAERGHYIFEKKGAIAGAYPFLSAGKISTLILANDVYERDVRHMSITYCKLTDLSKQLSDSWEIFRESLQ